MVNQIVRGIVQPNDGEKATVSTFAGEAQPDVLIAEPSGFSSNPSDGGDAIVVSINGDASRRVVINLVNGQKIVASQGETVIYSPDGGSSRVTFTENGIAFIAPNMTLNGRRVAVQGDPISSGGVIV